MVLGRGSVVIHNYNLQRVKNSGKGYYRQLESKIYDINDNNFRIDYLYSLLCNTLYSLSKLKCQCFSLIRLSVYQTHVSSLGSLITFIKKFHFNFVVMFVCSVK